MKNSLSMWLKYIEKIHNKNIDLTLDRILKVAKNLKIRKPAPIVFTISGTNGKGTTARCLEIILLKLKYKVGVYSSPHLIKYTERVRVNNSELSEQIHINSFMEVESMRLGIPLTYFEYTTLSSLLIFKKLNLDIVILEVGLGGRFDATNIISPDISIITNINLDHTEFLGSDLESIGFEKAGIMRFKKPVIFGDNKIVSSVFNVAKKLNVKLFRRNYEWYFQKKKKKWNFVFLDKQLKNLPIPNIPLENAATALAALYASDIKYDNKKIFFALKNVSLIGRFQIINIKKSFKIILDVAHNPHSAKYLSKILLSKFSKSKKIHAVIGMLKNKNIKDTVSFLIPIIEKWYCCKINNIRSASTEKISCFLPKKNTKRFSSIKEAFSFARNNAKKGDIILVFGSFYTVSEVMKILNINTN